MALFFAGNGESTDTIICALELPDNDWFKRALIEALTLMCDENNWSARGTASVDFARDKACDMNETLELNVFIPTIPIGTIQMFGSLTPPAKWLPCDGRAVGRVDYAELFATIGTLYGAGNGTTTFNVPNLTDKIPMGAGGAVVPSEGNTAGALTHTLTIGEIPSHDHNFAQTAHTHLLTDPGHVHQEKVSTGVSASVFTSGGGGNSTVGSAATTGSSPLNTVQAGTGITVQTASANITHNAQGGGAAHSILPPVIGVPFIIYSGV